MVVNISDSFQNFQRPESTQTSYSTFSSIHVGVVTASSSATNTVFVRVPSVNEVSELGPFKCMQGFNNLVTTPVKQTVTTTTAVVSGTTVVTSANLSNTTTNISGQYGNLVLPAVGDRVVVLLFNSSLDEGVVIGKL